VYYRIYSVLFRLSDEGSIHGLGPADPRISYYGEGAIIGGPARSGEEREQDEQQYRVGRLLFHGFGAQQLTVFWAHTQP
jgi:hypothetical protein